MEKLPKIRKGVGKRIKKIRLDLGTSQSDFGTTIGVSQRYIGMLEKGDRQPSQALIIAIAARWSRSERWIRTGRYLSNP